MKAKEDWFLWKDSAHSPAMNMAIDEVLLQSAETIGRPLLRLYEWDKKSISFGYTQKFAKVPQDGSLVVRRPTGGGIVHHLHHFTYTVTMPNSHWIVEDTKPVESYSWLNRCIQSSLDKLTLQSELAADDIPKNVDRAGMVCFVTPTKYDLLSDDRKIAGSAQRRTKLGMLHQGSIEREGIEQLTIPALRKSLPLGFEEIIPCSFTDWQPDEAFMQEARELAQEKYESTAWNQMR